MASRNRPKHAQTIPKDVGSMQTPTLGLELKATWCRKLLNGEKKVELRRYAIDAAYLGQPVYLLQTPDGSEGKSTLPDALMPAGYPGPCIAGIVVFDGVTEYSSYEQWLADEHKHCVPPGSPYGWQPGTTTALYGWHIASVRPVDPPQPVPAMRRVFSSWFATDEGGL